jgi:trimethylamine--corrinoid protein Co-methyltransferase
LIRYPAPHYLGAALKKQTSQLQRTPGQPSVQPHAGASVPTASMRPAVRPTLRLLDDSLEDRIIDEAFEVMEKVGLFIENEEAARLLQEAGARHDSASRRTFVPRRLVEASLAVVPPAIAMHDSSGERVYVVGGEHVHFDPGSAALHLFDPALEAQREAVTADVIRFARLTQKLDHFHFQSTGLISSDVPKPIADCYRLYLALQFCSKPVVTGSFTVESLIPMTAMLAAVRDGAEELRKKPLAIFDACPSPPLKWTNLTAQSVIECARAGIPSELVSMPLTGATAPVTLTGALVQHAAENLTGLVIAQLAAPGAPVIYGGSPAAFDLRTGTPPMGAMETMMLDAAYTQIGKRLGLPTHAYMGLSDAKCVDAQAGLESGIGAILAALAGVNVISGGGMLNFESTQSLEKLVIDHDICGMAYRLRAGIQQREEPMALDLLAAAAGGQQFLTHPHTLRWHRSELAYPKVLDRGNYQQWVEAGKPALAPRAARQVQTLLAEQEPPVLEQGIRQELLQIMAAHAKRFGMERLPVVN